MEIPRYARLEIERRFLVDRPPDLFGANVRLIEDLYLDGGRLWLRTITHEDGAREFKLGKKYERTDRWGGPVASLYLTPQEHAAFAALPGARLAKRRHRLALWSVDVFLGELDGLVTCEAECETAVDAGALQPPDWAGREVSEDPFFQGGTLCRVTAAELAARLGGS